MILSTEWYGAHAPAALPPDSFNETNEKCSTAVTLPRILVYSVKEVSACLPRVESLLPTIAVEDSLLEKRDTLKYRFSLSFRLRKCRFHT